MRHKGTLRQGFVTPYIEGWDHVSRRKFFDSMIYEQAQEFAKNVNHKYGYDLDLSSYQLQEVVKEKDASENPVLVAVCAWQSFRPNKELKFLSEFGESHAIA